MIDFPSCGYFYVMKRLGAARLEFDVKTRLGFTGRVDVKGFIVMLRLIQCVAPATHVHLLR